MSAEEQCNGVDDDCDGRVDEGTRNACGQCGADPIERCNGIDDDCDGAVDEGSFNACGTCGPAPAEVCNDRDDDCDGETDEGVLNPGGGCGPVPDETCNGIDDDFDQEVDEGALNACGACGLVPREECNTVDDDCDGLTDEGLLNDCGACGAPPEEVCDFEDNDCDGVVDEDGPARDLRNRCGLCGDVPVEVCNGRDDDCDGGVDEGVRNACGECGQVRNEVCNGADDDCDDATDEGTLNLCGMCGDPPSEICNGRDDDCDERVDEGVRNACGECGPLPLERCDERDNDCDGEIDEFLPLNLCGTDCGPAPNDVCNREDDDCDGAIDEGLPANACGLCGPLPEEVCDEEDNDCDGAVDEGHALNACRGCGPAPAERCDERDNDCDGRLDEDFRVGSSVDHCRACGAACSREHATPACVGGRCVLLACEDGWRDADFDPANGCEAAAPQAGTLHVRAGADDEVADGSLDRPYGTIGAALDASEAGTLVLVLPGEYAAADVDVDGVTVRAREALTATLTAVGTGPVVRITGADASLVAFTVDGRGHEEGVRLECASGCGAAFGVYLDRNEGVDMSFNEILGVANGAGPNGTAVAGVYVYVGPLSSHNDLVAHIERGNCFRVEGGPTIIIRTTCYGVGIGGGVSVDMRNDKPVHVSDSVFAQMHGVAVGRQAQQDVARVTVDYIVAARVDTVTDRVTPGEHILEAEPRFTNEVLDDFSLGPGSPCIDFGDPALGCGDEPRSEDGTCVPDVGHLAGTAQARSE